MQNNVNRPTSKTPYIVSALLGVAFIGSFVAWFVGYNPTNEMAEVGEGNGTATTGEVTATPTPEQVAPTPTTGTTGTPAPMPTPAPTNTYKNGTYDTVVTYRSPGGTDTLNVSLTVANDVVTGSSVSAAQADRTSQEFIGSFADKYKSAVVGKKLNDVSVGVVGGASLTSQAFMNALGQIKANAKS